MDDTVTVKRSTLERLVRRDLLMEEMEAWGVDNWNGWEYVERPTKEDITNAVKEITDETNS